MREIESSVKGRQHSVKAKRNRKNMKQKELKRSGLEIEKVIKQNMKKKGKLGKENKRKKQKVEIRTLRIKWGFSIVTFMKLVPKFNQDDLTKYLTLLEKLAN